MSDFWDIVDCYYLDGDEPKRVTNQTEDARSRADAKGWIARDQVGDVRVSTVFLGAGYENVVFKTMVFGGPLDQEQWRYRTKREALAGHAHAVEVVRAANLRELEDAVAARARACGNPGERAIAWE